MASDAGIETALAAGMLTSRATTHKSFAIDYVRAASAFYKNFSWSEWSYYERFRGAFSFDCVPGVLGDAPARSESARRIDAC